MGRPTFEAKAHGDESQESMQVSIPQTDSSRMVFLHGEVTEHVIAQVIAQLLHLAHVSKTPIHLIVSTYGGSIDEMFSLYDCIKFLPCPVHTVALGKVMSAGVLLLASGVKGKRLIGASARIMMHPASGGVVGNVFEVANQSQELTRLQNQMVNALIAETKMSAETIGKVMNPMLDFYIDAKQALEFGIADKIIGS